MKNNPILLVAGEPNSIFFEILFKALRKKNIKSPLVLICCKKILMRHMKKLNYKKKLEILEVERIIKKRLIINV